MLGFGLCHLRSCTRLEGQAAVKSGFDSKPRLALSLSCCHSCPLEREIAPRSIHVSIFRLRFTLSLFLCTRPERNASSLLALKVPQSYSASSFLQNAAAHDWRSRYSSIQNYSRSLLQTGVKMHYTRWERMYWRDSFNFLLVYTYVISQVWISSD